MRYPLNDRFLLQKSIIGKPINAFFGIDLICLNKYRNISFGEIFQQSLPIVVELPKSAVCVGHRGDECKQVSLEILEMFGVLNYRIEIGALDLFGVRFEEKEYEPILIFQSRNCKIQVV